MTDIFKFSAFLSLKNVHYGRLKRNLRLYPAKGGCDINTDTTA